MARGLLNRLLQHLRRAGLPPEGDATDAQLLALFIRQRDEAAFAALVRRHGPMVLGVCRRVLGGVHDAEDAFQATFLVLVRKAASLRNRTTVGNWLYGVAHRTALEARRALVRRRTREARAAVRPETPAPEAGEELRELLDRELGRLPDRYREVIVLCDLEGRGRQEVARALRCPEGTVASRLARARTLLATRLTRLGLPLAGGVMAASLAQDATAAVPEGLVASTVRAAGVTVAGKAVAGVVSSQVVALTEGVLRAMLLNRLQVLTLALLLALAGLGAGVFTYQAAAVEQPDSPAGPPARPGQKLAPPVATPQGDQLQVLTEQVLKAYGGAAKLQKATAFTRKLKQTEPNGRKMLSDHFVELPGKLRVVTEIDRDGKKETIVSIRNGADRWYTLNGKPVQLDGAEPVQEYWDDYLKYFGPRCVLRLRDQEHKVSLLGESKVAGRAALGVRVTRTAPNLKADFRWYFDKETGLLLREEDGAPARETLLADYKHVDGIPVPRRITLRRNGAVLTDTEVVEFRVVEKLDPALFQQP